MDSSDLDVCRRLINEIRRLLARKERMGKSNLYLEFSGFTSDLLYDEKVKNVIFVQLVDEFAQQSSGKSEADMVKRFELLNTVLTSLYEKCMRSSNRTR